MADASIIDRVADLTLFIIRVGKMDRRQLPEIEKIYQEKKLSNLAIVLNGLKLNGYGYGYGGYGYGGYGYGVMVMEKRGKDPCSIGSKIIRIVVFKYRGSYLTR